MKYALKYLIDRMYVAITYKSPCKKCLVKACCSDKCEEVIVFENFYWRSDDAKYKRFCAWAIIYSICILSFGIIKSLIDFKII